MSKKLWLCNRNNPNHKCHIKSITIHENEESAHLKDRIYKHFQIEPKMKIRIRNAKGHLVPICNSIKLNTKENAYHIEVYLPILRQVVNKNKFDFAQNHRMNTALVAKSILNNYGDRVSRVETFLKYSNQNNLNTHILPKIEQLEKRINFIEQRFHEIQNAEWKGGLKRPLLW